MVKNLKAAAMLVFLQQNKCPVTLKDSQRLFQYKSQLTSSDNKVPLDFCLILIMSVGGYITPLKQKQT